MRGKTGDGQSTQQSRGVQLEGVPPRAGAGARGAARVEPWIWRLGWGPRGRQRYAARHLPCRSAPATLVALRPRADTRSVGLGAGSRAGPSRSATAADSSAETRPISQRGRCFSRSVQSKAPRNRAVRRLAMLRPRAGFVSAGTAAPPRAVHSPGRALAVELGASTAAAGSLAGKYDSPQAMLYEVGSVQGTEQPGGSLGAAATSGGARSAGVGLTARGLIVGPRRWHSNRACSLRRQAARRVRGPPPLRAILHRVGGVQSTEPPGGILARWTTRADRRSTRVRWTRRVRPVGEGLRFIGGS